MDRRERIDSLQDSLLAAFQGFQSGVWTALPGVVVSVDNTGSEQTVDVQPALRMQFMNPDNSWTSVKPPVCIHCPVQFPGGGGATLTFPVKVGDECLLVFASRCIDSWWQQGAADGNVPEQAEYRMHDLSDGFALLGFRSVPRVLPNISTTETQLRTDDGVATIGLNPATYAINVQTTSAVNVTAPAVNLGASGATLRALVNDQMAALFNSHVHPLSGGGNTLPTATPMGAGQLTSAVKGS